MNRKFYLTFGLLLPAQAADKITLRIGNATISAYRTADLEDAKQEAIAAHKPVAWIASATKILG